MKLKRSSPALFIPRPPSMKQAHVHMPNQHVTIDNARCTYMFESFVRVIRYVYSIVLYHKQSILCTLTDIQCKTLWTCNVSLLDKSRFDHRVRLTPSSLLTVSLCLKRFACLLSSTIVVIHHRQATTLCCLYNFDISKCIGCKEGSQALLEEAQNRFERTTVVALPALGIHADSTLTLERFHQVPRRQKEGQ